MEILHLSYLTVKIGIIRVCLKFLFLISRGAKGETEKGETAKGRNGEGRNP